MKYRLTLSEKQMQILQLALEEYFRIRLNQWSDLADDLAFTGLDYKNHTKEEFEARIERRDNAENLFKKAMSEAQPDFYKQKQTEENLIVQDIWEVIRHQLYLDQDEKKDDWCVAARPPMQRSEEELPGIEKCQKGL